MTGLVALLLAHQGGWDEILLVLTPIALFAGLLWLANTRANKELQRRKAAADADDTAAGDRDRDRDDP